MEIVIHLINWIALYCITLNHVKRTISEERYYVRVENLNVIWKIKINNKQFSQVVYY